MPMALPFFFTPRNLNLPQPGPMGKAVRHGGEGENSPKEAHPVIIPISGPTPATASPLLLGWLPGECPLRRCFSCGK
ncbi:hypothetical protein PAHAL_9G365600 [Panicum hallii]|uniref:Uncharacterized protein n=1 Tax=Panicum hallii TaxID=206008 RepID=A0A2S3IN59_9POAL|nr:hypothetical protein PAHAL_9G365600 [Panicum hallii]